MCITNDFTYFINREQSCICYDLMLNYFYVSWIYSNISWWSPKAFIYLWYITSRQRSNNSLLVFSSFPRRERILSRNLSNKSSSIIPLLSTRLRNKEYFCIVLRCSSLTSINLLPLELACIFMNHNYFC